MHKKLSIVKKGVQDTQKHILLAVFQSFMHYLNSTHVGKDW